MNKYDVRYVKTPSIPTIVIADEYKQLGGWFRFIAGGVCIFMAQENEVLSIKLVGSEQAQVNGRPVDSQSTSESSILSVCTVLGGTR